MRFGRLDLNLLVALDVLLTERSVSIAADRLCLSQSAVSSALGRLREYFGDELLAQCGRAMVLTARAEALIEPVRSVLDQIRMTVAVTPPFDPLTCDRTIRIMASDYSTEVLLTHVLAGLARKAPRLRFEIQSIRDNPTIAIERGYVDLLLTIDYAVSVDHPSLDLFEDDYVVVGDRNNPAMAREMTPELYFEMGHVTARFGKERVAAFEDWFMRRQRQERRVEVVAPSFLSLPGLLLGTDRIATMHRRHAQMALQTLPLAFRELPFDIPPIRETVQWNITHNNDCALRWVIEQLRLFAGQPWTASDSNVVPFAMPEPKDRTRLEAEYRSSHLVR